MIDFKIQTDSDIDHDGQLVSVSSFRDVDETEFFNPEFLWRDGTEVWVSLVGKVALLFCILSWNDIKEEQDSDLTRTFRLLNINVFSIKLDKDDSDESSIFTIERDWFGIRLDEDKYDSFSILEVWLKRAYEKS